MVGDGRSLQKWQQGSGSRFIVRFALEVGIQIAFEGFKGGR